MATRAAALFVLWAGISLTGHAKRRDHGDSGTLRTDAGHLFRPLRAITGSELRELVDADAPLPFADEAPALSSSLVEKDTGASFPEKWSFLEPVKTLGAGAFGVVYKAKVKCAQGKTDVKMNKELGLPMVQQKIEDDAFVSVKLIKEKTSKVQTEIKVLEEMSGVTDTCVSAIGSPASIENRDGFWIMMPYLNGGDLQQLLLKCEKSSACLCLDAHGRHQQKRCWWGLGSSYTIPYILALFRDVVVGVDALHETTGRLHTDLKLENSMLNCQGKRCHAAVVDLGLTCKFKDCKESGTVTYVAPEIWKYDEKGYGRASRDVFSLGVMLYQLMYTAYPPWFYPESTREVGRIIESYSPHDDPNIPHYSGARHGVHALIVKMLENDYTQRISIKDVLKQLELIITEGYSPDAQANEMISKSPTQRHAAAVVPSCLFSKETQAVDIYDNPVRRENCINRPEEARGMFRCGMCVGCNPCCKCQVKRHGEIVKGYLRMQVCW